MGPIRDIVIAGASGAIGRQLNSLYRGDKSFRVLSTSRRPFDVGEPRDDSPHVSDVDLCTALGVDRLAKAIGDWGHGRLCVICSTGMFAEYRPIHTVSIDMWARLFADNVSSVQGLLRVIIPRMRKHGGGHLFCFSSHAAPEAFPLLGGFSAAKAAVESIVKTVANENAQFGVCATALAVATVDTEQERAMRPKAEYRDWLQTKQLFEMIQAMSDQRLSIANGNTVHVFNYSQSYFRQSYFDRLGVDVGEE